MMFFLSVLIVLPVGSVCLARTWIDRRGRTVEAEFLSIQNGQVTVRRERDDKVFTIPLEMLSDECKAFVQLQPNSVTEQVVTCPAAFEKELVGLPIATTPFDPSSAKAQEWTYLIIKNKHHEFKLVWSIPHLKSEPVKLQAGESYIFTVTTRRKADGRVDKQIVTKVQKDGKTVYEKDINTVK